MMWWGRGHCTERSGKAGETYQIQGFRGPHHDLSERCGYDLWHTGTAGRRVRHQPRGCGLLSPYGTRHIHRFGDYYFDLWNVPPPLESELTVPVV